MRILLIIGVAWLLASVVIGGWWALANHRLRGCRR